MRRLIESLLMIALLGGACSPRASARPLVADATPDPGTSGEASLVTSVGPIGLTVSDLDEAVLWYTSVLGFQAVETLELAGDAQERLTGVFGVRSRVARLRLGDETIELTDYLAPEGRPIPAGARSNDLWFQHIAIVVRDIHEAYTHLRSHNVRHASAGPQTLPDWNVSAGGISAFYFKDPDGHVLEVIQFPPGKGDPRWQRLEPPLFMGIDHTAIVVEHTEDSLAFYRDALGMRVAGSSENYGIEQERLNSVFGARLRITALRAASGPGLELLEYLAPRTGAPYPSDSRDNDLWQWHTTLTVTDVSGAMGVATRLGAWISPGMIDQPAAALALDDAAMARDPDGHAVLFAKP